jgi:hypothetical protein
LEAVFTQTWPGPPPAAGVAAGADLLEDAVGLLAAAGVVADDELLLELLLEPEPDELLADLLMPLCPWQAPLVVVTVCVVPSLHVTVWLAAAGAADCA